MGDKINNVGAMLKNPKQRNIYLTTAGLAILVVIIGGVYATSGGNKSSEQGGARMGNLPSVQAIPGSSTSVRYNEKVGEANIQGAQKALEQDKSFVPTITNKDGFSDESPMDSLEKVQKEKKEAENKEVEIKPEPEPEPEPVIQPPPVVHIPPPVMVAPAPQVVAQPKPVKKYGSDEDYLLLSAITGLHGIKETKAEFNYAGQALQINDAQQTNAQQSYSFPNQQGNNTNQKGELIAKAGTMFHAVLETGINSDEPSPVLAKIVSGDLKGTRLIGKISLSGEKVVVQFNTASIPGWSTSVKLNSVAVDPATSRTALASDVDRHYFLRYGVLLGAAFLGSYSDALKDKNSTTTVTPEGAVITSKGQKTSKDINREAVGGMGKELANETRSQVRGIKPTITVDAGIPIGILVMEDAYLDK